MDRYEIDWATGFRVVKLPPANATNIDVRKESTRPFGSINNTPKPQPPKVARNVV
jgi:hypothetical protein